MVETESKEVVQGTNVDLRKVKAIDFFDALDTGDFKKLAKTEEEFYDILDAYNDVTNRKVTGPDLVIHQLKVRIATITNFKDLLSMHGWDQEIGDKLIELGFKINEENYKEQILVIENYIKKYYRRLDEASSRKPENDQERVDPYIMMAKISVSLGFDFDYDSISLLKFVGLVLGLEQKSEKNEQ